MRLESEAASWKELGERQEIGLARARLESLNANLLQSQVERKMHSIVQDTTELEIAKAEAGRASLKTSCGVCWIKARVPPLNVLPARWGMRAKSVKASEKSCQTAGTHSTPGRTPSALCRHAG